MICGRFVTVVLALSFGLAITAVGAGSDQDQAIEEDYHVTRQEDRQRAVADLLSRVEQLRDSQPIEAAQILNRVGHFQIRMSIPDEAVKTFTSALHLVSPDLDIKTHIDSLNGLASSYDYLSKCPLVEPTANEAIQLSEHNNYPAGEADGLLILSDCQNYRDHALALDTARQALEIYKSLNGKRGMADTYAVIAHYEMTQQNLGESATSCEAALNLYRELGANEQQAEMLIYLGLMEHRKGMWENAISFYTQAQAMLDENAEPYRLGQIKLSIGDTFLESGLPEVALGRYQEALKYFTITKNQRAITISNWSIGRAEQALGQYESALQILTVARQDAAANDDSVLNAFCDDFIGRTYYSMGDYDQALSHFESALANYVKTKNIMEAARATALIGQIYENKGNLLKARAEYESAIQTFVRLSDEVNESATLFALGRVELKQNNLSKAENHLKNSIDLTEHMRRASTSTDLTAAFSATVQERYETYIECLMRQSVSESKIDLSTRAFETSELSRGRSLAELLRETQTDLPNGIDPQLAERERMLRQSLRVKEDYKVSVLAHSFKKQELDQLNVEIARLEKDYQSVNDAIHAQHPYYRQINEPIAWSLKQLQQTVIADDDTVLLEYSLGPEHSYVWSVTRNNIKSAQLPASDVIKEGAYKAYTLLKTAPEANSSDLATALSDLSQMVVAPVASDFNKRRIIVVADGALHYIPFQVLSPKADTEPLVSDHEIINVPSASILGDLRAEATSRQPTKTLVAFGNPVFQSNYPAQKNDTNPDVARVNSVEAQRWQQSLRDVEIDAGSFDPSALQPLFYAATELADLRSRSGENQAVIADQFEATRDRLLSTDLKQFAILHFATHGLLDTKRPQNSGLILSMVDRDGHPTNGFVTLQDIYNLRAPVDLVVLSACQTALGKEIQGEGLIGLTRGFMYAGASSVVASLWKVDDEATAELMKQFYANMLDQHMTPAAALRAAQNSLRQRPQWKSPYYWAAFTIQGEYNHVIGPAVQPDHRKTIAIVVISLIGVLTLGWWILRRRSIQQ